MAVRELGIDAQKMTHEILGYLNLSSGTADPGFLRNLNGLFGRIEECGGFDKSTWLAVGEYLRATLNEVRGSSDAFRQTHQAEAVLQLVFDHMLPAYREHHRDLLFHQTAERLFRPLFIGRVCEAVLQQGGDWNETERIVAGALDQLNDYLGHRPVAVLETEQKIQPYDHERVRPIPLYVRGAGVEVGPYQELIEKALEILQQTDPTLLFQAWFEPEMLDELAVDPRAYDFDHPVNKRPNYLFGQWDLERLDNSGRSRRFVLQQVALDAILSRVREHDHLPREEALFEAAAVLAGTMLMGSGVSGNRPDAHGSDTTLATLVQHIAAYRDAFYKQLFSQLSGAQAKRLKAETRELRQPFGGARQHFNHQIALRRAEQLQHVHLARIFSRMGYTEAAGRQVRVVPVASARMLCDMYCRLIAAQRAIRNGRLEQAEDMLLEVEDLLDRAIRCGAVVDPWNILGFSAQYSLFPAMENSVHDHRIDELIDLVGEIFATYMQIEKEAAAAGNTQIRESISGRFERLAQWWDQFASLEVGSVEGISGQETRESAAHVATALRAWHEAGGAAGDIAFWRDHVEQFRSPKAYVLVVEALLEQRDPVAAMALLIQWLSQADEIPLVEEDYSFHDLLLQWMADLWEPADGTSSARQRPEVDRWRLSRKFFDCLEANAAHYWHVPRFELGPPNDRADRSANNGPAEPNPPQDGDGLFEAAYEGVTYRDSTDDGFEGEMLESGYHDSDFALVGEAERIFDRLIFNTSLAQLWRTAALASMSGHGETADQQAVAQRDDVLFGWLDQAGTNYRQLLELLAMVSGYRIPPPRGTQESLIEYDRRRGVKDTLLEQIIATCVETADALRMLRVTIGRETPNVALDVWEVLAERVLRALVRGDVDSVRHHWDDLLATLREQPLLYVALARGGDPQRIVASRNIQYVLRRLLVYLPRLGLLVESARLLETIQRMELEHPVGPGAITEFDQMFQLGCKAIVRSLVISSEKWHGGKTAAARSAADEDLIEFLEQVVEALLRCWLDHSRGVRLSVLEMVHAPERWDEVKAFVKRYGAELFTQQFMNLGNLRAILHQGVNSWLQSLEEELEPAEQFRLLKELDGRIAREDAVRLLSLVLEAIVENYSQYIDYNSTTTQSDRGEMLYTLLDFLRLQAAYDRVAWNLQPVVLAHDVLVGCGRDRAAEIWRIAVARRTREMADEHLKRFDALSRKYGMRLPSIADRLNERFVRSMAIDKLRALVRPAIEEAEDHESLKAFERLEGEIAQFTDGLSGAGFEVPAWLEALEEEVEQVHSGSMDETETVDPYLDVPQVRLGLSDATRQVKAIVRAKWR